jgi:hypothetical protein
MLEILQGCMKREEKYLRIHLLNRKLSLLIRNLIRRSIFVIREACGYDIVSLVSLTDARRYLIRRQVLTNPLVNIVCCSCGGSLHSGDSR